MLHARRTAIFAIAALVTPLSCAVSTALADTPHSQAQEVINFALLDYGGKLHELRRTPGKAVVLFFTANGCPVARQSATKLKALDEKFGDRGVQILLVNSNSADTRKAIAEESFELKLGHLPVLKDDTQGVARHLRVHRTGECIAISTQDWTIFYRGAIDDQLAEGAQKPQPTVFHLETALEEFLAGKAISQPKTAARGCLINFDAGEGSDDAPVSYAREVAPILERKCISCHSEGNVGSWSMTDHAKVKGMAAMIEEVILCRRMPPWDADPAFGKFENDSSLKLAEAQTLLRWIHQGAPRGDGADPLTIARVEPARDWPLGTPDIILRLPQPEKIPATGVLEYRHIEVAAGNGEDVWVGGAWIKPGNKQVVHHVIAWLKQDDEKNHDVNERESVAGYAPGITQGWFPKGTGRLLPKNARFNIEMHYTTNGVDTTDQTEVGLYLLKEPPAKAIKNLWVYDGGFTIPPGDSDAATHAIFGFKQPATLYSLMPHMHLRGRWMKFELLLPDGKRETLLSVPRYDFNWQQVYTLARPRPIPAGAWVLVTGGHDNSPLNPANPDPRKTVRWGDQSFEEMFIGILGVTWDGPPAKATALKE